TTAIHITHSMSELRAVAGAWRDRIARRILVRASCPLIAIAGSCADRLHAFCAGRIDPARIHVIRNGVSRAPAADRERFRRAWGCEPNDFVLGAVARLEVQKNPLFLVELLSRLPERV